MENQILDLKKDDSIKGVDVYTYKYRGHNFAAIFYKEEVKPGYSKVSTQIKGAGGSWHQESIILNDILNLVQDKNHVFMCLASAAIHGYQKHLYNIA